MGSWILEGHPDKTKKTSEEVAAELTSLFFQNLKPIEKIIVTRNE
jgi:hypothetical protein